MVERARSLRGHAVGLDVDDVLQLRVVEQEAVDRAVVVVGEALAEAVDVEPPDAFLAFPHAAEEAHFAIVGEQVDDLVVHAFVDQVAVEELQLAHVEFVLAPGQALAPVRPLCFKRCELVFGHRLSPNLYVLHTIWERRAQVNQGHQTAERFQPFDFLAIGPDAAPHEEGRGRQEHDRGDQDGLPHLLSSPTTYVLTSADHAAAHRAEEGEHEQVERGHLAAHLVRRDALDRRVLRPAPRQGRNEGTAEGHHRMVQLVVGISEARMRGHRRAGEDDRRRADIGVLVALAEPVTNTPPRKMPGEHRDEQQRAEQARRSPLRSSR